MNVAPEPGETDEYNRATRLKVVTLLVVEACDWTPDRKWRSRGGSTVASLSM